MNKIELYLLGVLTGLGLLTAIILYQGNEEALPYREVKTASMSNSPKYVSNEPWEELPYIRLETDRVEKLFNKYDVPYEFRDYTRSLCDIYDIDPLVFISMIQLESLWQKHPHYNTVIDYRMYGDKKQYTDLGLAQLSTRYEGYFKERFFNPRVIMDLGYIREKWDITDDYISLQVGANYLSYLYKYFGNYEEALMAYNTGKGNVIRGKIPKITVQYAVAIMGNYLDRDTKGEEI